MKRRVRLSISSWIITMGCFAIIIMGFGMVDFETIFQGWGFCFYAGVVVAVCLAGLYYSPMSLRVTDKDLEVVRSLKIKTIPLSDIRDVRLLIPTMGAVRLCGSGGFMGYWGWFRERDLGKYFAYYGKASDCFLVVLNTGRKYMLGCKDAPEMVEAIRERMQPA